MNIIRRFRIIVSALAVLAAMPLLYGCGGGGGGAAPAAGTTPAVNTAAGNGLLRANVTFAGPPRGKSAAAVTDADVILVTITINGIYSETGEEFPEQSTTLEVAYGALSSAETVSLEVPIGFNHLLQATAAYPGGGSETVRGLIPEVIEGQSVTVTVNRRSTVIADAAAAMAENLGLTLADLTQGQIDQLAAAVDAMYAAGTAYSDMSINDVLAYGAGADIPASIVITPSQASVALGAAQQFTAVVKNAFGVPIGEAVTWSAPSSIGTIDAAGVFTASAVGAGDVTAATGSITVAAPVTVLELGDVVSVTVAPATVAALDAVTGQTLTFTMMGTDAYGNTATISGVTWTSTGGLSAAGSEGVFNVIDIGSQTVTGSYNGLSDSVTFTTYAAAPQVQGVSLPSAAFGTSVSGAFTAVNGTAPFTWSISSGALPPAWTFDSSTGVFSGTYPDYVCSYEAYVRVTDALGRTTDQYTDGTVSFSLGVGAELADFKSQLQIADGGLNDISNLLQAMKALAIQEIASSCSGGTGGCDADYQTMKAQIDAVIASATWNGTLLLDGTYASTGLQAVLSGGNPVTLEALIPDHSSTALGLSSSVLVSPSTATGASALLDTAIQAVSASRASIGARVSVSDALTDGFAALQTYYPQGSCLEDLVKYTQVGDDMLYKVDYALQAMRNLAVQAQNGGITAQERQALQIEAQAWVDFFDILAATATFYDNKLLDGTLSQTCANAGAPSVSISATTASALSVASTELVNNAAGSQIKIDNAITAVSSQRATLASQQNTIMGLITP